LSSSPLLLPDRSHIEHPSHDSSSRNPWLPRSPASLKRRNGTKTRARRETALSPVRLGGKAEHITTIHSLKQKKTQETQDREGGKTRRTNRNKPKRERKDKKRHEIQERALEKKKKGIRCTHTRARPRSGGGARQQ